MRTVKIQGGLGNQLFGLAFARSIRVLTGDLVALDLASYGADRYGRGFVLRALAQSLGGMTLSRRPVLASRAADRLGRLIPLAGFIGETSPPPGDPAALTRLARRDAYFSGYWQDEAYIAEADALQAAVRAEVFHHTAETPTCDAVIHYRTYKDEARPDRQGVPGTGYFRQCIDILGARDVVLVSDDPALALDRIGDIGARITVHAGQSAWHDMALLLKARRLILTNSSFSWWGGYAGDAERIYYPGRDRLFHYPHPAARFTLVRT